MQPSLPAMEKAWRSSRWTGLRLEAKRKYEHRKIWYEARGPIPDGYDVHHKNEDRSHNDLDNLELKLHAKHWREHLEKRGTVTNRFGTWSMRGMPDGEALR